MRFSAALGAALAFSGCGTVALTHHDAPAAVVQAIDLTCSWLIDKSSPPTLDEMTRLHWRPFMKREEAAIPNLMQRFAKGPPALAGYRLRFGEAGDILASRWENYCYGIRSSDLMPEGDPARLARAEQALAALDTRIGKAMPDAVPMQMSFKSGQAKPFVAKANRDLAFAFAVVVLEHGGVEWRVLPTHVLSTPAEIKQPINGGLQQ